MLGYGCRSEFWTELLVICGWELGSRGVGVRELPAILSFPAAIALVGTSVEGLHLLFICSSRACKKPSGEPATLICSGEPDGSFDTAARNGKQVSYH